MTRFMLLILMFIIMNFVVQKVLNVQLTVVQSLIISVGYATTGIIYKSMEDR